MKRILIFLTFVECFFMVLANPAIKEFKIQGLDQKIPYGFSGMTIWDGSLYVVTEKCNIIYKVNVKTLTITDTLTLPDGQWEIEGICIYKGKLILIDNLQSAVYECQIERNLQLKEIGKLDTVYRGHYKGIAVNEEKGLCYVLIDKDLKIITYAFGKNDILTNTDISVPLTNAWSGATDIVYYYDVQIDMNSGILVLMSGTGQDISDKKYIVERVPLTKNGMPDPELSEEFEGLGTREDMGISDAMDINLEGLAIDNNNIYIVSDNYDFKNGNKSLNCATVDSAIKSSLFIKIDYQVKEVEEGKDEKPKTEITTQMSSAPEDIPAILLAYPVIKHIDANTKPFDYNDRYLFIDGNAKPSAAHPYKFLKVNKEWNSEKGNKSEPFFKKANALHNNHMVHVWIHSVNLGNYKSVGVNSTFVDYQYEQGIDELLKKAATYVQSDTDTPGDTSPPIEAPQNLDVNGSASKSSPTATLLDYLKNLNAVVQNWTNISLDDWKTINAYRKQLIDSIGPDKPIKIKTRQELEEIAKFLSFQPEYIMLTPIPVQIKDNDEWKLTVEFTDNANNRQSFDYEYRIAGGVSIGINSMIYLTGLHDDEVYTEMDSSQGKLLAKIDDTKKVDFGLGANAEIGFRTGHFVHPFVNVGFFIPVKDDITPFMALGGGVGLGNKKFNFSLSAGLAGGAVDRLKNRYKDVDVSSIPPEEELTQKVWKFSWFFGLGMSYSIR